MSNVIRFFEYGRKYIPLSSNNGIVNKTGKVVRNFFRTSNKTSKVIEASTRTSIGFVPQELNIVTDKTKRTVVSGFRPQANNETTEKTFCLKKFIDLLHKSVEKLKKPKTRTTAGFQPQELKSHRHEKVRRKIGFDSTETVPITRQRINNNETRITAGFIPQELENKHTLKVILKNVFDVLLFRIRATAQRTPTREAIGFIPQELNNKFGKQAVSKIGFLI